MAAPRLSATGGKGRGGPSKWEPGNKLWDTMVLHKHVDCLAKYPSQVVVDSDGSNDSVFATFKRKAFVLFNGE